MPVWEVPPTCDTFVMHHTHVSYFQGNLRPRVPFFLSFFLFSSFSANTVISFRVFTCPLPLGLSLRNVMYTTFFIPSQWLSVLAVKWLVRFIPVFAVKGGKEKADFSLSGFIGVYEKATWYLVPWTSITKACNPWHNALWLVKKTRVTLSTIRYNCFILF